MFDDSHYKTEVFIDPLSARRALSNVLHNAICFSPANEWVEVSIADGDGDVTISIADRGAGMSEDLLEKVFEPFEKADMSSTSEHGGLGLGLTLAKAYVEANRAP